jgi:hypothetical protein
MTSVSPHFVAKVISGSPGREEGPKPLAKLTAKPRIPFSNAVLREVPIARSMKESRPFAARPIARANKY